MGKEIRGTTLPGRLVVMGLKTQRLQIFANPLSCQIRKGKLGWRRAMGQLGSWFFTHLLLEPVVAGGASNMGFSSADQASFAQLNSSGRANPSGAGAGAGTGSLQMGRKGMCFSYGSSSECVSQRGLL